jgi:Mn-dependent DtxR family transcriptional regulator
METKTYPNDSIHNSEQGPQDGLTKREYFAALAMQGLLTRVPKRHGDETDLGIIEAKRIAAESRIMADLLIEELNEGGNNE